MKTCRGRRQVEIAGRGTEWWMISEKVGYLIPGIREILKEKGKSFQDVGIDWKRIERMMDEDRYSDLTSYVREL